MTHIVEIAPDVAETLTDGPLYELCASDDPKLLAFATFLHEMIHWWQHIGTTSGLVALLSRATQAHVISRAFKGSSNSCAILPKPGHAACGQPSGPDVRSHNLAVNGWMDIEFAYVLLCTPERGSAVVRDRFFDCIGQSYWAYLTDTFGLIRATVGGESALFCRHRDHTEDFERLRHAGVAGFAPGTPTTVPPLGLQAIQEAHARFSELQFRHVSTCETWHDFKTQGLFEANYTAPFEAFLRVSKMDYPKRPTDPQVNLFLLVCDLAMMPSIGYTDTLHDCSGFIDAISPGVRFLRLINVLQHAPQKIRDKLLDDATLPSSEAYTSITGFLCSVLEWTAPGDICRAISQRVDDTPAAVDLIEGAIAGDVQPVNGSVAYVYGRHLATMRDRVNHPDFYCWPAYYFHDGLMPMKFADVQRLLGRSAPPFIRDPKRSVVGVATQLGINREKGGELVSKYFMYQMVYDLGTQWVASPSKFNFDFRWADPQWTIDDYREYITPVFQRMYGCAPDDVGLI